MLGLLPSDGQCFTLSCGRLPLTTTQAENAGLPGALPHQHDVCETPHFIKPGIYAFWTLAGPDLKHFVSTNVKREWHSVDAFVDWCLGRDLHTQMPNHLLLFWWIIRFWKSQEPHSQPERR